MKQISQPTLGRCEQPAVATHPVSGEAFFAWSELFGNGYPHRRLWIGTEQGARPLAEFHNAYLEDISLVWGRDFKLYLAYSAGSGDGRKVHIHAFDALLNQRYLHVSPGPSLNPSICRHETSDGIVLVYSTLASTYAYHISTRGVWHIEIFSGRSRPTVAMNVDGGLAVGLARFDGKSSIVLPSREISLSGYIKEPIALAFIGAQVIAAYNQDFQMRHASINASDGSINWQKAIGPSENISKRPRMSPIALGNYQIAWQVQATKKIAIYDSWTGMVNTDIAGRHPSFAAGTSKMVFVHGPDHARHAVWYDDGVDVKEPTVEPEPQKAQWNVGAGIRFAMVQRGDEPVGNEYYIVADKFSMAPGRLHMYTYSVEANKVYVTGRA